MSFKIIEKTKLWFIIPACIFVLGILFYIINGGFNLDIEFAGGTMMQIDIGKEFDAREDIEPLVRDITGDTNPQVQKVSGAGGENQVSIKVKEIDTDTAVKLYEAIAEKFGLDTENNANLVEQGSISPTISSEMKRTALISVTVAVILMLIYITIRFRDWRFGLSSIVALVHDVLIVLSMYAIFRIPINNNFIAAMLTIVGYSINDTIVIFDRVRENRKYYRADQLDQLGDISVSQSIGRSINTSITTIIMVLLLFLMGVQSVRWFAFPLMAGFIAGTYSSIFVATPVWVLLSKAGKNASGKKPAVQKS